MKKTFILALLILMLFTSNIFINPRVAYSDELDDLNKEIAELQSALEASKKATTPLESQLTSLTKQLDGITTQVGIIEKDLLQKKKDISAGYEKLDTQHELFNATIRNSYIKNYSFTPFLIFLAGGDAAEMTKLLAYQRRDAEQDKNIITTIALEIVGLEERKVRLESEEDRLAAIKVSLNKDKVEIEKVVAGAKTYQASLSGKIADLSAKQQSIISARSGGSITSVGSVPQAGDPNASISFKSQAPAGSFAAFSFGAYTHRNGMSQYGAKKQAESKNYKDIIQWYYGHGVKKDDGMSDSIDVQGYGTMSFQTYLYGLGEMPSDWPIEALKAQAVAARTYANRASKPICTTEACQVFVKSKSDNPPAAWKQAVDETNKEVIDGDVSAQYSSTTGGYTNTSGWDTTDRTNSGEWTSRAWESMAGSPWFYRGWYRQGYSNSGNSCGRSHPWMSGEEMADIINAWIVRKNPNGADIGRIIPVTINQCGISGVSGNPYSMAELRDKANGSGGAVTSISSVSTSNNNSGQTTNVSFSTNRGTINIPGSEFKETFNLRAPGYISIPQSGFAFFNIEKN